MIYTAKICVECGANEKYWTYNEYTGETICKRCGMVLNAPIHYNWLYGKIKTDIAQIKIHLTIIE